MSEAGSSWQQQLPGRPEYVGNARRWVADHVDHPDAALLASELWAAAIREAPDLVLLTVSTAGHRVRITAYTPHAATPAAISEVGRALLEALATEHGIAPDGCGFYAELEAAK